MRVCALWASCERYCAKRDEVLLDMIDYAMLNHKKFGLESRAVYADDTAAIQAALATPIDWERVDAARVAYVGESQNFLQDSLRHHCLV